MEIRISPKSEVASWVHSLQLTKPSTSIALLLSGDRWSCVGDVVLATEESEILGIATIAPQGEMGDGNPTIVAIYILPDNRASGVGYLLLEATVDYMVSKGLTPIHMDVMNSRVMRMIDRLTPERRQFIVTMDLSMGGAMDAMLEM